ncbi:hypothetical protein NRL37_16800 [Metapseudomonas otitidis]|uniref:hypothetical protein n=1 Tax=Metapseudomonas otitidis TaxID=319939 RepID=UPI00227A7780|nr:hypothetical protein [Pseudomonas otitidis]WAF83760.1 hypothetical protein NRL37_16800 [Pseudomonas otitidis]
MRAALWPGQASLPVATRWMPRACGRRQTFNDPNMSLLSMACFRIFPAIKSNYSIVMVSRKSVLHKVSGALKEPKIKHNHLFLLNKLSTINEIDGHH